MLETVPSAALLGLDAYRVRVEVSITRGAPLIHMVGLPASSVREGRERIRAAVTRIGLHVPGLRITVNLAPADVRKDGAAFDLPITIGILAAGGQVPGERARRWGMVGELGLDGRVRPVRGMLPIALHFRAAGDVEGLIVPLPNLAETRPVDGLEVRGAPDLGAVIEFLAGRAGLPLAADHARARGRGSPATPAPTSVRRVPGAGAPDFSDVRGQKRAKRALEVAAAGGHHVLLRGEPGCGKTMLARRLPSILPRLTLPEALEATAVHSVAGCLPPGMGLLERRPFRAPHHTVSATGLVGGGAIPRPGEISLAHHGVLFLDELAEFRRGALEVLRQPLEDGAITIVRARAAARFPARFVLVAAMNPCPCGYHTSARGSCRCDPVLVRRYLARVSGPLLDRIDVHLDVGAVHWSELRRERGGEPSARVRERVEAARERAAERLRREGRMPIPNASLDGADLRKFCRLDTAGEELLRRAAERFRLSARACHRILRLARTVADVEGGEAIAAAHVAEAIQYRVLDRRDHD